MSSRRRFLRNLAVATVALLAQKGVVRATTAVLRSPKIADTSRGFAAFAALRGATFLVTGEQSGVQRWCLAEAQEYQRGSQVENFSLTFTGPAAAPAPQGIYQFEHPQLGRVELFVVAGRVSDQTVGYQAVINRLV